jgi:hypothetical protein
MKLNPIYTINIIIIYRGKLAKHDSVHINFCRLGAPRCLDPALKQGTKKSFGATHFGASIF